MVSKKGKKVFMVTDNVGAVCAGMVADMQNLVKEVGVYAKLKELEAKRQLKASAVAKLTSVIMFERRFSPLLTQVILGGVDAKPQVWVLDPLGSLITDEYASVGTGAEMATGVMEAGYSAGMSEKDAQGADRVLDKGGDREGLDERERHRPPDAGQAGLPRGSDFDLVSKAQRHSGTLSEWSFPSFKDTKRNLLSSKTSVSSFSFSVTVRSLFSTIPLNFAIWLGLSGQFISVLRLARLTRRKRRAACCSSGREYSSTLFPVAPLTRDLMTSSMLLLLFLSFIAFKTL